MAQIENQRARKAPAPRACVWRSPARVLSAAACASADESAFSRAFTASFISALADTAGGGAAGRSAGLVRSARAACANL